METTTIVIIVIAVVAVIAIVAAIVAAAKARRNRREALQQRFGPEYERAVDDQGRRKGESELADRAEHRDELEIRPLSPAQRDQYEAAWRDTQARFVDDPGPAVHDGHVLITEVMRERGYPVDDFETRSRDLSVDHPDVVQDYRSAQDISSANDRGEASTEDLRQAMVHFRSLFDRLLQS